MKPEKQEKNRNLDGTFAKGVSGNPGGRPKGKSLKTWLREKFSDMTEEEREQFLSKVSAETQWKMAEGNPENNVDPDTGNPIPVLVKFLDGDEDNKHTEGV